MASKINFILKATSVVTTHQWWRCERCLPEFTVFRPSIARNMYRISRTSAWLKPYWKSHLLHFSRMISVSPQKNYKYIARGQNFPLIKRSKTPPLVNSPAKIVRIRSRFSALSIGWYSSMATVPTGFEGLLAWQNGGQRLIHAVASFSISHY